jgi:hypothetical protein
VIQGLSWALGIDCYLHCAWCNQSSDKVEKTNELLKHHLTKLIQETHSSWTKLLPIALIRFRNTPEKQILAPFESVYGCPFLTKPSVQKGYPLPQISHSHKTHESWVTKPAAKFVSFAPAHPQDGIGHY